LQNFKTMNFRQKRQNLTEFIKKIGGQTSRLFVPSEANAYRPGFLQSKILFYFAILVFIVKIAVIGPSVNFPKNIFFADITKNALINFVNQGRIDMGLPPLVKNQKLDRAAELKAQDMLQKGYFSHQSPEGVTPWFWFKKAGYNYKYAGENLAVGFVDSKEVYNAWYDSISHRQNILGSNYNEIGTAVLSGFGDNKTAIVVQFFGLAEPLSAPVYSAKTTAFVLSQSTEAPDKINSYLKYLNLITYNYEKISVDKLQSSKATEIKNLKN